MNTQTESKIDPVGYVNNLGLLFSFTRIQSRPDDFSKTWNKDSYHFLVTISNKSGSWSGFYSMGSGHGLKLKSGHRLPPKPKLVDVLYSLVMDSYAIEFGTFEQWANEFGYETDSRKAENIYRACVKTGLTLRRMFGDAGLQQLREVFQDY